MKKLFIPPVLVLICLLIIIAFYLWLPEYNLIPFPLNICGIAISFIGFVIMGKARNLFNKHKTNLEFEQSSHLVTEGIYAKTRNPMYIGMFLLLLGIGVCFMNIFSILTPLVFISAIQLMFIPMEEKLMLDAFGQSYLDYKKSVRRWI